MKLGITKAEVQKLPPEEQLAAARAFKKAGYDSKEIYEVFGSFVEADLTPEEGNAKAKAAYQNFRVEVKTTYGRQV